MLLFSNVFIDQHNHMQHNYSSDLIIQYLYNELPALEHLEVDYAIENEPSWENAYNGLKKAFDALPKIQFFPRQGVVRSILQYSRMAS